MKKIFTMILVCGSFWASAQPEDGIASVSLYKKSTGYKYNEGDTVVIQITKYNSTPITNTFSLTIYESVLNGARWDTVLTYQNMQTGENAYQYLFKWVARSEKTSFKQVRVNGWDRNSASFSVNIPTGIEDDLLMKKDVQPIAIYDMQGRKVEQAEYGQLVIIAYLDGSRRKTVIAE